MEEVAVEVVDGQKSNPPSNNNTTPQSTTSTFSDTPPKSSLKKPRARANSESSSVPNKISKTSPRATRSSQNPDFAAKQRKFLNRVHDPTRRDNSDSENSHEIMTPTSAKTTKEKLKFVDRRSVDLKRKLDKESPQLQRKDLENDEDGSSKKKRKEPTKVVGGVDSYCWRCHRDGSVIACEICPRVYHLKCVQIEVAPAKGWMCPECSTITQAENTDTRSRAMRMLSLDQLCNLLRYALNRMQNYEGADEFAKPVDISAFPQYKDFIVKPMDLAQLKQNIKAKMYGSTEAFLADAKWIVHNSIIFNSVQSKFTNTARALLKICRQEMQEIENCPDCYQNAHTRSSDSWFIEACRRPHILVWAKLKGFPFWPAKAMTTNNENLVDVRFFGAHDRAWVPLGSCFLFSKLPPAPSSNKSKRNLEDCLQELEHHIKKLRDKFGRFEYPPFKTPYDPNNEDSQLALFLPMYEAKVPGKRAMRPSLHHDGARRSLWQQKPALPPVEKKVTEDTPTEAVSIGNKKTPSTSKQVSKISQTNSPKSPMVTLLVNDNPVTPEPETTLLRDDAENISTVKQPGTPQPTKKAHRVPLTAAAKKCFATDKCCVRCQTQNTDNWHQTQGGNLFCTSCFAKESEKPENEPQNQTKADDSTFTNDEAAIELENEEAEKVLPHTEANNLVSTIDWIAIDSSVPELDQKSLSTVAVENRDSGDSSSKESIDRTEHIPTAGDDAPAMDFADDDGSPPKFVIRKADEIHSPEPMKKGSIVDRLQEKLCFVVEEAIGQVIQSKSNFNNENETASVMDENITTEDTTENITRIDENEAEAKAVEKLVSEQTYQTKDLPIAKVVLHNLKSITPADDKTGTNYSKSNKTSKEAELEVQSSSETGSEPDTDISSLHESESFVNCEEVTKKKKEININNVVKTLQERKNSVEESNDQTNKSPTTKESNPVMLDDSGDEVPILIIDEGEELLDENHKSTGKPDKSRRKGIPAKVFSRSSTSTDSSETSLPEELSKASTIVREVLDEVSGQFRRSSGESNVTITLHSPDVATSQKTKTKEIRSVNISKSLSLSVVNESSNNLEMDCVESDIDDEVVADPQVKKVNPRPTARKTLPNLPRPIEIPKQKEQISLLNKKKKDNEQETTKSRETQTLIDLATPPPPLINLQTTKMYGPAKMQNGVSHTVPRLLPAKPTSSQTRADIGPANAQIEEAISKMSGQMRTMIEDMIRGVSEAGATEATVKALQIEMERLQWRHRQEMAELKHNTDILVMEVRASMEAEKQRALLDAKHKYEMEKEQAVHETKRKQWCAFCLKEAQLYCCWNTAYCSYNCQQSHWLPHMNSCLNKQHQDNNIPETSPRGALPRPGYNLSPGQVGFLINS